MRRLAQRRRGAEGIRFARRRGDAVDLWVTAKPLSASALALNAYRRKIEMAFGQTHLSVSASPRELHISAPLRFCATKI